MLTSFQCRNDIFKVQEMKKKHDEQLKLLLEAIETVLNENSHRVYIDDAPHIVEFKLPDNFSLEALRKALLNQKLKFFQKRIVADEILVHEYLLLPSLESIEVWYKPYARPRI